MKLAKVIGVIAIALTLLAAETHADLECHGDTACLAECACDCHSGSALAAGDGRAWNAPEDVSPVLLAEAYCDEIMLVADIFRPPAVH